MRIELSKCAGNRSRRRRRKSLNLLRREVSISCSLVRASTKQRKSLLAVGKNSAIELFAALTSRRVFDVIIEITQIERAFEYLRLRSEKPQQPYSSEACGNTSLGGA